MNWFKITVFAALPKGSTTNMYLVVNDVKVVTVQLSLVITDKFCQVNDWTVVDCKFSLDGTCVFYIAYIQLPHEWHIHAFAYNLQKTSSGPLSSANLTGK